MDEFFGFMEKQDKIIKIVLALPCVDIIWTIYKLLKSYSKNDMTWFVVGIILIIIGAPFMWLLDMIWIAINDRPFWFNYDGNNSSNNSSSESTNEENKGE